MSNIHYKVEHCGIVVLAAGGSSRLGTPKQLLSYQGKSLVQRASAAAIQTGIKPVVVVIGANHNLLKTELEKMPVQVVHNEAWQEGIASSLRCGLAAVIKSSPATDGIIFMVCDQPFVTSAILGGLLSKQHETNCPIVASSYENNMGTPALFHKKFFTGLMSLNGDAGAGRLIKKYESETTTIKFPQGSIDIDTPGDVQSLLKKLSRKSQKRLE